jgi:hypothetical protein
MKPKALRWIRWGIVSILILSLGALAAGSVAKTKPSASNGTSFGPTGKAVNGVAQDALAVPEPAVAGGTSVAAGESTTTGSGGTTADVAGLPPLGDRIVRTADITLQVKKGRFDAAWADAYLLADRFGGQVMSSSRGTPSPQPIPLQQDSSTQSSGARQPNFGDITIRFPAERFVAATNALRGLGLVQADNTTSQDVSQEYVDLQSRLRNLRAERDVFLALFDRASTIRDTLAVQAQLTNVEGQIEQITGRIKYLDARTTFSTVTVHLGEPGAIVTTPVDEGPSFAAAWDTARMGLVRIAGAALILALWLTPFAILSLLGLALWRRTRGPAPQL